MKICEGIKKREDCLVKVNCDTLLLYRALKQSDIRIKCDYQNQPSVLYFQYKGYFSE